MRQISPRIHSGRTVRGVIVTAHDHEIVPEKWITFDINQSSLDMAGVLPEEEKTKRKSSDAVRMDKERKKRGLEPR
jgi:hypothetical protein